MIESSNRMHPLAILLVGISLAGFIGSSFASKIETPPPDPMTTLWYDKPGVRFFDGFPLGNGRLGMTVLGDPTKERIVLNKESMWSGSKAEHNKPDAHMNLEEIRRLLLEGKNTEAEELVSEWQKRQFS
jgi:hypothetical protein